MWTGRTATIRFETKRQLERIKQAAQLRRWSLNTFIMAAAEALSDRILSPNIEPKDQKANWAEHDNQQQETGI